jgi:hypothetical protein
MLGNDLHLLVLDGEGALGLSAFMILGGAGRILLIYW